MKSCGLPSVKKTKSGYSTDSDVLKKLQNEHPIVEKVLEYRRACETVFYICRRPNNMYR